MFKIKLFFLFNFVFFFNNQLSAHFDYNENCIGIYKQIVSLRLAEARQSLDKERLKDPKNSILLLLENYYDFLSVVSAEDPSLFKQFEINKNKRLELLEIESDKSSPFYNYVQGEIHFQWAIAKLKFEEYVTGALEIQKAYKYLMKNQEQFPDFIPNRKSVGILKVLIGAIPDNYQWALSAMGLKGNTKEGIDILEGLKRDLPNSEHYFYFDEVAIYTAFFQLTITNDPKVFEKTQETFKKMDKNNLLAYYIKSFVELETRHSDQCIETIHLAKKLKNYSDLPFLNYIMACAKLNKGEDDAVNYFQSYLNAYKGIYFVKDSYLRIAWYYLLKGNPDKYREYESLCKNVNKGVSEVDMVAKRMSESNGLPNLFLLKARLLFDGGYYSQALSLLNNKDINQFKFDFEKLDFLFRMGRIYQELDKEDLAIQYFINAIHSGQQTHYFYSAYSALQLGYIFMDRKDFEKAKGYFKMALNMPNKEYKTSIQSRAKVAISKLK